MAFLELASGPRRGERIHLEPGRTVIGRHPDCTIVLDAASVSRQHAVVSRTSDAVVVEDLHSRNGTTINGRPLTSPRRLADGDEIVICGQRLVFTDQPSGTRIQTADETDGLVTDTGAEAVIMSQIEVPGPGNAGLGRHPEATLRAALDLDRAIGGSLAIEEVLPRLLDGLLGIFPQAERAFVLLHDPQSRRLVLRGRRTKAPPESGPLRLSLSLINRVADARRAVLSADAGADSRFSGSDSILDCRIRSVMCVPVERADGGLLGVVQLDSRDIRAGFDGDDLDVLAGIAGRAALAIEQAIEHGEQLGRQQLNRDLELAQRVQQGLLPSRPPELSGYEIFDYYESARHVGGDFFGYVPLADGRLAVVLADVSGKGVAAALLMAALSADVRYCLASERDLGRAVSLINESFLRGGWDDRFATLVVTVVDPAAHRVEICNAGHLPVFVREASGMVRNVAGDLGGLPLGMAGSHDYRTCQMTIAPGTVLVMCTDGVSEALDHEERCYGFERLEQVLAEPAAGAVDLGRRVIADVDRHAAGQLRSDDICLVCVGRAGEISASTQSAQDPPPA